MIFRNLLLKEKIKANKEITEFHKNHLHFLKYDIGISDDDDALQKLKKEFDEVEIQNKKALESQEKLCDVADVVLYALIAEILLSIFHFEIGVIIAETIALFATLYGFVSVKHQLRYLYLVPIIPMLGTIIYKIFALI